MAGLDEAFEAGARDHWQQPARVVQALLPFAVAVDLGAGSGYFTRRLAAHGRVYPVEPEPAYFPEALRSLAELPEPADLILAVNVWRHLDLTTLRDHLTDGGRLAVIDWHHHDTIVGPALHLRTPEPAQVPGFNLRARYDFLPYQWFVVLD